MSIFLLLTVGIVSGQVKSVRWDASLGGQAMEARLMDHFAQEFNQQVGGKFDVRKFPKAMAKLKKQVKRTKEILSANTEAALSVEAIHEELDFRYEVMNYYSLPWKCVEFSVTAAVVRSVKWGVVFLSLD